MIQFGKKFGKVLVFFLVFTPHLLIQAGLGDVELTLDLSADSLAPFFAALRATLLLNCIAWHHGHCILRRATFDERFTKPPSRWIKINLVDGEEFKGALYLRNDSLYILALGNKVGTVHYMKGYEKFFEEFADAIALPFGEGYADLAGKFGDELISDLLQLVTLGQEPARMAANDIAEYGVDEENPPQVLVVKRAVLTYSVLIAESMRTKEIRTRCIAHWKGCTRITRLEAQRTLLWNKLCELFLTKDIDDQVTKYQSAMNDILVREIRDIDGIVDFLVDRRKISKGQADLLVAPTPAPVQEVAHMQQYKHIRPHPPREPTPAPEPAAVPAPPRVLLPPSTLPAMSDVGASAAAMPPMHFRSKE